MRLLDVETLKLESFWDHRRRPEYAILSHTWGDNEVVFADLHSPSDDSQKKLSWNKTLGACKVAKLSRLKYIWIDSLCIDKTSSAELSEAINSMFSWYRNAKMCIAYLADLEFGKDDFGRFGLMDASALAKSRWFSRGWTLQELLAPRLMFFYDHKWQSLGNKVTLAHGIAACTGIDAQILQGLHGMRSECVATRLSWASKRKTTRVEDMAYCLLGIFGVNMPLLYGEGEKAFLRLQEEIMKTTNDHSIFTWRHPKAKEHDTRLLQTGLLAPSPSYFDGVEPLATFRDLAEANPSFELTNVGVSIELPMFKLDKRLYVAILDCARDPPRRVGLLLYSQGHNSSFFSRVHNYTGEWPSDIARSEGTRRRIFVSAPHETNHGVHELSFSGGCLRTCLTEASTKAGYKIEGCLYDSEAGNGLGLPGWNNRHWSLSTDQHEFWQQNGSSSEPGWRRLWHDKSWCSSENRLEIPGDPMVLIVAFLVRHARTGSRFLVLIGTGERPEFLQVDCRFLERDLSLERENLAELAVSLRGGFKFYSLIRYIYFEYFDLTHTQYQFQRFERDSTQSGDAGLWGGRNEVHHVRLKRHETDDGNEMQLEVIDDPAYKRL